MLAIGCFTVVMAAMWAGPADGAELQLTNQQSGTTKSLFGVSFPDARHGYAVGDAGTILATADGGETWKAQASGTRQRLLAVAFPDARHGFAVGNEGTILATIDGGDTWKAQRSGTRQRLLAVAFPDARRGFAVGNEAIILTTTDGGETWNDQGVQRVVEGRPVGESLAGVSFVDGDHGYVLDRPSGSISATTNGGATWMARDPKFSHRLFALRFLNFDQGYAVGEEGQVLATADGGQTWTPEHCCQTKQLLFGVAFAEDGTGLVVGTSLVSTGAELGERQIGVVLSKRRGAKTWTDHRAEHGSVLTSVAFSEPSTGYAVGTGGTILRVRTDASASERSGRGGAVWWLFFSLLSAVAVMAVVTRARRHGRKQGGQG